MQHYHPYFVHFPIALLTAGILFDLLGYLLDKDSLKDAGWWCLAGGFIGALFATATGLWVWFGMDHLHEGEFGRIVTWHMWGQITVTVLFTGLFVWRSVPGKNLPDYSGTAWTQLGIGVILAGGLLYGAHLGGELVYEFGHGINPDVLKKDDHDSGESSDEPVQNEQNREKRTQDNGEDTEPKNSTNDGDGHDDHNHHEH